MLCKDTLWRDITNTYSTAKKWYYNCNKLHRVFVWGLPDSPNDYHFRLFSNQDYLPPDLYCRYRDSSFPTFLPGWDHVRIYTCPLLYTVLVCRRCTVQTWGRHQRRFFEFGLVWRGHSSHPSLSFLQLYVAVCVHVCVCACVWRACVCACVCMCVHVCVCTCGWLYTYACVIVCGGWVNVCMCEEERELRMMWVQR